MNLDDGNQISGSFAFEGLGAPGLPARGSEGPKLMEMDVEDMPYEGSYASPEAGPPARKRLKLGEEWPANANDSVSLQKRVVEHYSHKINNVREKYVELAAELFFLRAGGNMMDYCVWRKRPATPHLLSFLKSQRLDAGDELARPTIGATPVALSTQLPSDVQHLSTQGVAWSLPVGGRHGMLLARASRPTPLIPPRYPGGTPLIQENGPPPMEIAESAAATTSSPTAQDQILEKAKQEAYVVRRVGELQRAGLWADKRLPKVMEPPRCKAHWDYLLEEMAWLAADFAQERKWKKAAAKKCARMVQKYFQDKALAAQRAEKAQEIHLRRIAAFVAKEIRTFWTNVEKLVEFKRNSRLEEQRKRALDQQLSFIVDQTEKYSKKLALGISRPQEATGAGSDEEFRPSGVEEDDEETIAAADAEDAKAGGRKRELEALQKEALMDLDEVLDALPPAYLARRARSAGSSDYSAASRSSDDESTVEAQEKTENPADHAKEMDDLKAEAEMSVEELRKKYGGVGRAASERDETSSTEEESEDESESESANESLSEMSASSALGALVEEKEMDAGEAEERVRAAAAEAEALQPTGYTLSDTAVATPVPTLLKHSLREYQHVGLHWLATMRNRKLNGILADEMGLGKTIQTIALLAHLAESGDWGPHLVVVPTSVTINWEMEFKKWCPAFKILTYYGTIKERKAKRAGWTKPNAFHICIASYKLVVQDHQSFRRKKWSYLILDEAQNIKNFKSQRWQLLLNFQTERRLLLTGTPLQNDLMELWSLMHFLMPGVFASHREFKEWFGIPVSSMVEGTEAYNENLIRRLHKVLRPFLLRRLKSEVEKQMPKKYEHVLMCRLSKRQRFLYDDFMSRAKTKETLASGNLLSVMNVLMQLRKVCNHPNLFEARPIVSPLRLEPLEVKIPSILLICNQEERAPSTLAPTLLELEFESAFSAHRRRHLAAPRRLVEEAPPPAPRPPRAPLRMHVRAARRPPPRVPGTTPVPGASIEDTPLNIEDEFHLPVVAERSRVRRAETLSRVARDNERRSWRLPLYGADLRDAVTLKPYEPPYRMDPLTRTKEIVDQFLMYVPRATCPGISMSVGPGAAAERSRRERLDNTLPAILKPEIDPLHEIITRTAVAFPHPRLIQYDCGKLQTLEPLLRDLKMGGHRALIFTQMTRMLDVLEAFLTYRGHTYLRLDGSTKVDLRQTLVERFNGDRRVFAFILSTRSGGVGLNLTGADTVIFYDSDWNPTMDAQAQDRCHRIGQTRDVHVYRLVSAQTVEQNILRKAAQKRQLGEITIEEGNFTTAALKQGSVRDLFKDDTSSTITEPLETATDANPEELERALEGCEDEADARAARLARAEARAELAEFDEQQPLNDDDDPPPPKKSKAERELHALEEQLTPIERYAMRVVETSEEAGAAERRAAADMERQLKEWENARLKLAETKAPEQEDADEEMDLTYGRTEAQVWINENTDEVMPMWCPPTPPRGPNDIYVDHCLSSLYSNDAALETELPVVRSRPSRPRSPHQNSSSARLAARPPPRAPRSLFERPQQSTALVRSRARPRVAGNARETERTADWTRTEDAALRLAARLQGLPADRRSNSTAVTPNWDFAADLVADAGRAYRSPRMCRERAELLPTPDEERRAQRRGHKPQRRPLNDDSPRLPRAHIDAIHSAHSILQAKRSTPKRVREEVPLNKNPRQAAVLGECGIEYNNPPTPMAVAAARAERIARDKLKESGRSGPPPAPTTAAAPSNVPQQRLVRAPTPNKPGVSGLQTVVGTSAVGTSIVGPSVVGASVLPTNVVGASVVGPSVVATSAGVLFRQQALVRHQLKVLQQPAQGVTGVEVRRGPGGLRVAARAVTAPRLRPTRPQHQPPH